MNNQYCNDDFRLCMDINEDYENYETIFDDCKIPADSFGHHALDMLVVFADPPTWDDYGVAGSSDEAEAIK